MPVIVKVVTVSFPCIPPPTLHVNRRLSACLALLLISDAFLLTHTHMHTHCEYMHIHAQKQFTSCSFWFWVNVVGQKGRSNFLFTGRALQQETRGWMFQKAASTQAQRYKTEINQRGQSEPQDGLYGNRASPLLLSFICLSLSLSTDIMSGEAELDPKRVLHKRPVTSLLYKKHCVLICPFSYKLDVDESCGSLDFQILCLIVQLLFRDMSRVRRG